jgi:hypothetical protein
LINEKNLIFSADPEIIYVLLMDSDPSHSGSMRMWIRIRISNESREKIQKSAFFSISLEHTLLIALSLFHCVLSLTGMRASVHVDLPGWTKEGLPALKVSHRVCVVFLTHWYQH